MLANYGYEDGSGGFYITIDTDKCNGCGACVTACPAGVLAMGENEYEFDAEGEVALVVPDHRKKIKYSCAPCKPVSGCASADLPCVKACGPDAIAHSW